MNIFKLVALLAGVSTIITTVITVIVPYINNETHSPPEISTINQSTEKQPRSDEEIPPEIYKETDKDTAKEDITKEDTAKEDTAKENTAKENTPI